jgi:hypothetical protein
MKLNTLKLNPKNPRVIKDDKFKQLVKSIQEFPEMMAKRPMVCVTDPVDGKLFPLGGNMRLKALQHLKFADIPDEWVSLADDWTEEKRAEFTIKDNVGFGEWNWGELSEDWDIDLLSDWGLDVSDLSEPEVLEAEAEEKEQNKKLSDRFIIPPFSVLDTKQGVWQQRKNYWLSLGIKSEEGRKASVFNVSGNIELTADYDTSNFSDSTLQFQKDLGTDGVSIFDPVLCELVYKWFNVPNGKILDCFAGGSVRGIVAAKLGYEYLGNDLRREQIDANRINAKEVLQDSELYPTWTCGDSLNIDTIAKGYEADLLFSCPPYADLEVYSDAKEDISNMPYKEFISVYREIIQKSCVLLKNDRFAVFVVGDVRDKNGFYRNFISDTIQSFLDNGLFLYNNIKVLKPIGNAAMRAAKYMNQRKVCLIHEDMLVFYKGNPKKIKANYPELDLRYMQDEETIK